MTISLQQLVDAARERCERERSRVPSRELTARVEHAGFVGRQPGIFRRALQADGMSVVAEVKGASPLAGQLKADYSPRAVGMAYEKGGAAAISVLTEPRYFGGSLEALEDVSSAVGVPTLRKDFIVDAYQVEQAALAGASAVLLIADVLAEDPLRALTSRAHELGLDALIEVHEAAALPGALAAESGLIGINNRNLQTMEVDWEHSLRMASEIPGDVVAVAESGVRDGEQLRRLEEAGYAAALIGTSLMTAPEPGDALARLLGEVKS
ncbi:MAG: indole-3-glycerol-phosphate synthase TrpC [Acidobacteria bacterium]|nr:indole-3-glycerol-phosphate synthase TrpC [Acidobacteriota bacterium]